MTYGYSNSNYFPLNYYPGYYQGSMQRTVAQESGGTQSQMHSGPAFSIPVVPLGTGQQFPGPTMQESFIENILRFNKGKIGTFYFTYQGNSKWNAMVYRGRVETAGRDHIIISDPSSGKRYLLMMANLDWVEFDEQINYPYHEINPEIQSHLTTTE
ncbi:spore coat protein GerQ [Niallia oryzisoli]|uniref:spore coat protein GerQ n=1 Tax=Niallia oryzisoli TaxID=1737571 RepID=UPI003734D4F1